MLIPIDDPRQILVRQAARGLARFGLVGPYGHCSLRLDDQSFLVCAAKPMGLVTAKDPGAVVPVVGPLPQGVLGEVRAHQQIYANRPDVKGICRVFPPKVNSLSAMNLTPKVRHGFSCYFAPCPPLWTDPQLLRTDERAEGVAQQLKDTNAIVLKGNGAIVVADSLGKAVALTFFLEDSARVELDLRSTGFDGPPMLETAAALQRATWEGRVWERMWEYVTHTDPEMPVG
jgi:HCOMODA/2-hydroxy-3-carboxy-muconic semialdehyde decarboxylase